MIGSGDPLRVYVSGEAQFLEALLKLIEREFANLPATVPSLKRGAYYQKELLLWVP